MTADRDPYVTLGLPRTASLDEVKRAYRRLVKANHPDAAGEAALPRFLAIQSAYDRIVGPANDANGSGGGGEGPSGARPWGADPSRARATHRAYGGRSRRTRASSGATGPTGPAGPATGTSRDARGAAGPSGTAGSTGTRPDESAEASPNGPGGPAGAADDGPGTSAPGGDGRSTRPPRPGRPGNKATLGSTSYDGAEKEPFEPDWGGASWYGTTSGTYWTLNPKEYADPRKHGPEYQARARRGRRPDPADTPPVPETMTDAGPVAPAAEPSVEPEPGTEGPAVPPTHTATSWWEGTTDGAEAAAASASAAGASAAQSAPTAHSAPTAGSSAGAAPDRPAPGPATEAGWRGGPPADLDLDAVTASIRDWLDGGETGIVGRVGRAVIGWAPIALGIGWLAGEVTGCARFSATCDTNAAPIAWIAQLLALLLLVVATRLATIATIATAVTLAAAVPGTLILSATGGATDVASGRTALGGLLVIAWVAGIGVGIWRELRRRAGPGPVS